MQKVVIATSNPHKVEEIAAVLGQIGFACVPMADAGIPEPDEDGATFEANARIKAVTYAKALGATVRELAGVPHSRRTARFVGGLCVARPDGSIVAEARGHFEGWIGEAPRGANGFGYDPLLVLTDGRTSAELTPAEKNERSHRGNALRMLAQCLAPAVHLPRT